MKGAILVSAVAFVMACFASVGAKAQTDVSMFLKKDSVQRSVIDTTAADLYKVIGHHGPAIENSHMALRLYFNNSGAIDVYSKAKNQLELKKFHWYPSKEQIAAGAGCDEYRVGKTTGLGGVSLWDGEKEVKLVATAGRRVEVQKTRKGAKMSMLARGVEYKGEKVDILVTVSVSNKSREAEIEMECVSGQKVTFVTGVNFHVGQHVFVADGVIAVWGIHPADIVENPLPLGGGMRFCKKEWGQVDVMAENGFVQIRTVKPTKKAKTTVVAACSRESEINTREKFVNYMTKGKIKNIVFPTNE